MHIGFSKGYTLKVLLLAILVLLIAGCRREPSTPARPTVRVWAAASLQSVLTEIARAYPHADIEFNFASSGTLQRQIENGAPADLFISAADWNMDALQHRKLIDPATRRVLARNRLVLIVPKNSLHRMRAFSDLAKPQIETVALGAPQSVPAGKYAVQVLEKTGVWKTVEKKAIRCKDVRAVLIQVEQGNVDAGIVYASDAAQSKRVQVVATADTNHHAPIRYPVAVVTNAPQPGAARKFAEFLQTATARKILQRHRFVPDTRESG